MHILTFRPRRHSSPDRIILTLLLLLLFVAPPLVWARNVSGVETLRQTSKAFIEVADRASPAVVGIKVENKAPREQLWEWPFGEPYDPFEEDFFDFFFRRRSPRPRSPQPRSPQVAQGSGFIISADGYILTNNHLVGDAEKVMVKLVDGRELDAKIIGTDRGSDVAVIKIDSGGLTFLELGDSDSLEVGEWVLAIGNPFGLTRTVTAGIVSAKGRSGMGLVDYEDFIQTDAAINFGNSGGPLLNLDGKVIGINTAIVGSSGNIGIGFAIPVNMAKGIYKQLIDTGTVVRGFLGVGPRDLTPEMAAYFGLDDIKGVIIAEIVKESAAEKAGLKHNDIIVEFNGLPVENANEFRNRVAMLKPGTKVEMVVLRDGKRKKITVELGELTPESQSRGVRPQALEQIGLTVQDLTDDLARGLGYKDLTGVIVTDVTPGSLAARAGITRGTLIMEVNQKPVKNTIDFNKAMEQAATEGTVLLWVSNGRYNFYVALKLPEK